MQVGVQADVLWLEAFDAEPDFLFSLGVQVSQVIEKSSRSPWARSLLNEQSRDVAVPECSVGSLCIRTRRQSLCRVSLSRRFCKRAYRKTASSASTRRGCVSMVPRFWWCNAPRSNAAGGAADRGVCRGGAFGSTGTSASGRSPSAPTFRECRGGEFAGPSHTRQSPNASDFEGTSAARPSPSTGALKLLT